MSLSGDVPPTERRAWRRASLGLRVLVPGIIAVVAWRELASLDWAGAWRTARASEPGFVGLALLVAVAAVMVMGLYDGLSFGRFGRLSGFRRWGLGMMLFSWTNFLTIGPIGGPAARIVLYRRSGATAADIIGGLARLYVGMISGLIAWLIASISPVPSEYDGLGVRAIIAVLASVVIVFTAGRVLAMVRPIAGGITPRRLVLLGLVGAADWGGVLATFVLCGAAVGQDAGVVEQARSMFLGHLAGMLSMIPGGLGAADAIWLKSLTAGGANAETAAAQIMLFRVVYYIVPWSIALAALAFLYSSTWNKGRADNRSVSD